MKPFPENGLVLDLEEPFGGVSKEAPPGNRSEGWSPATLIAV